MAGKQTIAPGYLLQTRRSGLRLAWLVWLAAIAGALFPPPSWGQPLRRLSAFEQQVSQAPEVLAAAADLEAHLQTQEVVAAENGWRLYGETGVGGVEEPQVGGDVRDYRRLDVLAGLRYPILAGRQKALQQTDDARLQTQLKELDRRLILDQTLLAVRMHYIAYWSAQEKMEAARRLLEGQAEAAGVLQQRAAEGLLRDSDHSELLTIFDLARRDLARHQTQARRALSMLFHLTSGEEPQPFQAAFPDLPTVEICPEGIRRQVEAHHPRLAQLQLQVAAARKAVSRSSRSWGDAYLAIYSNLSVESDIGEPGYQMGVKVHVDVPLSVRQADTARRLAARAELERLSRRLEAARRSLTAQALDALDAWQAADRDVAFAARRLAAARARLKEDLLRYAHLEGDTYEKLLRSRLDLYQAAVATIDAFARRLEHLARLLSLLPGPAAAGDATIAAAGCAADGPRRSEAFLGIYLWRSDRFLQRWEQQPELLEKLRRQGVGRLLVSFSADQLQELERPETVAAWQVMLAAARKQGIAVELLLGEPSWILPAFRGQLVALVQRLLRLPFDGVHLDLEPDQLTHTGLSREALLAQMVETIAAVAEVCPLPLGISVHPRYLEPGPDADDLAQRLKKAGVSEVALMIYRTDLPQVAATAGSIIGAYGGLTFSVAQSVEGHLGPSASHADSGRSAFIQQMKGLHQRLSRPGFRSILVQGWTDFEAMDP